MISSVLRHRLGHQLFPSRFHGDFRRGFHSSPRLGDWRKQIAKIRNADSRATVLVAAGSMVCLAAVGVMAIPLYKIYCQSFGGAMWDSSANDDVPVKEKLLPPSQRRELVTVHFNCDAHHSMPVQFAPCQDKMEVLVGEPTLAFFACYNTTPDTLYGIATYSIYPSSATYYFNKLQCFCFEEQRIKPHEYIELPVFFYLEPEFSEDPNTAAAHNIVLSYTFFSTDATP
eukprot:NODE_4115_length_860_cov_74.604192_g3797_i0.p1 GENE.NODE_4115_length_860_cov_74.604192_g3797_i0~~NODE_4115_length_860_cov_74.604192_g3797_i0.p1  ORF type:complete len:228 (-),score=40.39 NODE_4115_length_860_cov_74.604192_g3797_i0:127-810(-)